MFYQKICCWELVPDQRTTLLNRLSALPCGLSQHCGVCRLSYKRNVKEKKNPKYSQDYNKNDSNYEGEKSYKGFVDEITFFTA